MITHKRAAPLEQRPAQKRQKVTRACDYCKRRRRKCTGDCPCSVCVRHTQACTYLANYTRGKLVEPYRNDSDGTANVDASSRHAIVSMRSTNGAPQDTAFVAQYSGPSSAHNFLRRAWKRFGKDDAIPSVLSETPNKRASIFQYGDRPSPDVPASLKNFPAQPRAEQLLALYFEIAAPTYRFLHEPTLKSWLGHFSRLISSEQDVEALPKAKQSIVIQIVATAALYELDSLNLSDEEVYQAFLETEALYHAAQQKLEEDTGRASLESVQARLCTIQYLLSTSRPNEATYTFGTTVQLMFALGLHRRSTQKETDIIRAESRKRAYWVAYIIDAYLSSMLGRPTLMRDEDADQEFPMLVDDEDMSSTKVKQRYKDSAMLAVVKHAQLAIVAKRVLRAQSLGPSDGNSASYRSAVKFNEEVQRWVDDLPVLLSGAVKPSSLIPLFRRQVSVIKRSQAHCIMLINRPFILCDAKEQPHLVPLVDACIAATKDCLKLMTDVIANCSMLSAFWNTHYMTFNALAVIYVWLIQRRIGRLPPSSEVSDEYELFRFAERVQAHLSAITRHCAPSLRYGVVLDELQQEARLWLGDYTFAQQRRDSMPGSNRHGHETAAVDTPSNILCSTEQDWGELDPNLWMHLDTFPFTEFFVT